MFLTPDEISRLLPVVNGTKHEVESHCTSETKDEGEMKMDLETFHQVQLHRVKTTKRLGPGKRLQHFLQRRS